MLKMSKMYDAKIGEGPWSNHPISATDAQIIDQLTDLMKQQGMVETADIMSGYKMLSDVEILQKLRARDGMYGDIEEDGSPSTKKGKQALYLNLEDSFGEHLISADMIITLTTRDAYQGQDYIYSIVLNVKPAPEFGKSLQEYILRFTSEDMRNDMVKYLKQKLQNQAKALIV